MALGIGVVRQRLRRRPGAGLGEGDGIGDARADAVLHRRDPRGVDRTLGQQLSAQRLDRIARLPVREFLRIDINRECCNPLVFMAASFGTSSFLGVRESLVPRAQRRC